MQYRLLAHRPVLVKERGIRCRAVEYKLIEAKIENRFASQSKREGQLITVLLIKKFWLKNPALGLTRWAVLAVTLAVSVNSLWAQAPRIDGNADGTGAEIAGSIKGKIVDQTGNLVSGAQVELLKENEISGQKTDTGDDGQFLFGNVQPGNYTIKVTAEGFASQSFSATLRSGEASTVPQITLAVATEKTEVRVSVSPVEIAEIQIKEQEKQRVFGIIPNFYVTYEPNPAPLNAKQKMKLAWRSNVDPLTIAGVGFVAGIEQADDAFSGYGQGAAGYGKRFGASYADVAISTFLSGAVLPTVFRQDPRYFYQGTGSTRSRLWHAVKSSFMCRGDNGKWGLNYSSIGGALATGAISNLYYPSTDRNGVGLTFETAFIRIGESAGANIFQEFVVRKLTPGLSHRPAQESHN